MWRNAFWVTALGIIAAYLFFFALGAFSFTDSLVLSSLVVLLAVMWVVHGVLDARRERELRDPRLVHARERRGF
jgi:high-affinity Fe2+/Pb2+ permease